ncbi:GNAT family N-acetyltransferase [Alkalilimnicola ehrlichii MLHE-1]|uniref:GCN5-related N-acetyltransferase n=1 Tax=Alkalilimnicola ehrlichii (strain ATCC BAA-1101 / DSM 17681 / MLHE-1) TaxID=187272 RepID=Q0A9U7_ALKEH|nr:bifunctional acetate--CoA ligase family protein/GNAT family N-acetyltransferase [Alkalilimnicola ehrlichii]ABI56390.1 GCN5-related N-acetyltransferase [Alkalilimnicola ehrlichii MLHE-1]
MTVRNLEHLFQPRAIALIGTGGDTDSLLLRNLVGAGFRGPVMPVMPGKRALHGVLCYPDVESLPMVPDLAVLDVPFNRVPDAIRALGEKGTRAAVLVGKPAPNLSPEDYRAQIQAVLDAAKPFLLRLLGPGCIDLTVPRTGVNASVAPFRPGAGRAALVTESAAVATRALDWCQSEGLGLSHLIHLGGAMDVDTGDVLDYLASDVHSRAILLYLEYIDDARKFMSAARRAARVKPVVVLKPRRGSKGAAEDAVYEAAFRRAGLVRVADLDELFNAVEILTSARKPGRQGPLAVLGNSRSLGLLAANELEAYGGTLEGLSEESSEGLALLARDPESTANPLDLGGDADADAYGKALDTLAGDKRIGGTLVINQPNELVDNTAIVDVLEAHARKSRRAVLAVWSGPRAGARGRERLKQTMPAFEGPEEAVRAYMRLVQYQRNQELLMETPTSMPEAFETDPESARLLISAALTAGRDQLNEYQAQQLLTAYEIPCVPSRRATTPEEAGREAAAMEGPLALKIMSPDIVHKSEVRGVALDLESPEAVVQEAHAMEARLRELYPDARVDGYLLQPMTPREGAFELCVAVMPGGRFGPVIRFGHGGTEAQVIADVAYGLPPLNMHLAREMMSQTRIYSMLASNRLRAADLDALALTLIKVSQMVIDFEAIESLEINPLWATAEGVVALDSRVVIRPPYTGDPARRLAIRPYPKELEEELNLPNGRRFLLRPILPEDEPALTKMVERTPPEQLRLRFFRTIRTLPHEMAARLTQIDYDREMALAVTDPGLPGQVELWGVVRISADPDNETAEYAIMVDNNVTGMGLGPLLMRRIVEYARQRGIREVYGEVLRENRPMLRINEAMGFTVKTSVDDPNVMHVTLRLDGNGDDTAG